MLAYLISQVNLSESNYTLTINEDSLDLIEQIRTMCWNGAASRLTLSLPRDYLKTAKVFNCISDKFKNEKYTLISYFFYSQSYYENNKSDIKPIIYIVKLLLNKSSDFYYELRQSVLISNYCIPTPELIDRYIDELVLYLIDDAYLPLVRKVAPELVDVYNSILSKNTKDESSMIAEGNEICRIFSNHISWELLSW